jgi:O-antigen/teichoic acid export membrane protein
MIRRTGHHAPSLLVAVVVALVVLTLVPALAYWQALFGLLVFAVFLAYALLKHNRGLCEHCAAALPLDAPAVAGRYRMRFRVVHLFERKALAVGYLVAVVAASFLYEHPAGKFAWAAAQASLGYLLIVYVTHQRLQPWCPECRAGGEEQVTPSTPAPVSTSA